MSIGFRVATAFDDPWRCCRRPSRRWTDRNVSLKPAHCSSDCRGMAIDRHWDFPDIRERMTERQVLWRAVAGRIPIVTQKRAQPTKSEIERVAERLWQDAFGGAAGMSWQKVQPDSSAHQIVERLARAAFNFSINLSAWWSE